MTKAVKSRFADPNQKKPENPVTKTIGSVIMFFYRARKLIMALPVAYFALRLAYYNSLHLPSQVGIFLQNNGYFLRMIGGGASGGEFRLPCPDDVLQEGNVCLGHQHFLPGSASAGAHQ